MNSKEPFDRQWDKGSVTVWLEDLKTGNNQASQLLWGRYVQQLARLACRKLGSNRKTVFDEEDIVVSVFNKFLVGTEHGRFPRLDDRNDLWQILLVLTEHKTIDFLRKMNAVKRGGDAVEQLDSFSFVVGNEPTPDVVIQSKELLEVLLNELDNDADKAIAIGKLEGKTIAEISDELQISRRSIDRKLQLIRRRWAAKLEQEQDKQFD